MANLNIAIKIAADDKASGPLGKITGALRDMRGTGQSLVSGGFRSLQTVGVAAMGGLAVGATALAGGFALAAKTAIDMNSTLETSTLQFTTLMGDAGEAEAHVKSLFEFAKKTPFETGPIIEASRMMQTFGGDILNTKDNLTLIGDAAAATSAPIDELGFWVGRLYSNLEAGQPFGEAAMRLQELAVMSPQARKRMEELQEAGAGADEIFAVLQEDLGKFTGAMESQAGTWEGLVSTIKDSLAITAAGALKPFFDMAKGGLGAIADFLSSPELTAGVEMFAERLGGIGTVAGLFMDRLQSGMPFMEAFQAGVTQMALVFGMAGPEARALGEAVALFFGQVQSALAPVLAFIENNVQLSDVLMGLGVAVATVMVPALGAILMAVGPVILVFAAVVAAVALVRTAWENNWGGIQEKTQAVIDFIVPLVQNGIAAIAAWWAQNGDAILMKAQTTWEAVQLMISTALTAISAGVQVFIAAVQVFWTQHGEAILLTLQTAWELIKETISNALDLIKSIWEAFRLLFEGDWFAFGEALYDVWSTAWTLIVDFFGGLWDMMKPWLEGLWSNLQTWWNGIDWGGLGRKAIDAIVAGLKAAGGAILSTLSGIISNAIADAIARATGGGGGGAAGAGGGAGGAYATGGFTGYGAASAVAGLVHRGEYVFNAAAVRNLGVQNLEMMHRAAQRPSAGSPSTGSGGMSVTLINPQFYGVQDAENLLAQLEALSA